MNVQRLKTLGLGAIATLATVGIPLGGWGHANPSTAVVLAPGTERPTLRLGSNNDSVRELQALLSLLGYYTGAIDGNFQSATEAAVEQFQADAGLTADGIVGVATWSRLLPAPSTELTPPVPAPRAIAPPPASTSANPSATSPANAPVDLPTLRMGMYGPAVTRLQQRLKGLGFYTGALDGTFGSQTEAAVKAFQRSVNLTSDGIVGPATWNALLR